MGVLALWIYPVKAMLGQLVDSVDVTETGFEGDRGWVVVDAASGERIANKRGPTDPALRACRASLVDGELRVALPDGSVVAGEVAIGEALTELMGRAVRLERAADAAAFHDFAPVHLITTRTLARLRSLGPDSDFDARRFRPNALLDDGTAPPAFSEDELIGRSLRADAGPSLSVNFPTPRCVVPTRAREDLPRDPSLLKTIARNHMVEIPGFGRFACAGAYAEVAAPGRLRAGDRLAVA